MKRNCPFRISIFDAIAPQIVTAGAMNLAVCLADTADFAAYCRSVAARKKATINGCGSSTDDRDCGTNNVAM
jgi:hypothetical protein